MTKDHEQLWRHYLTADETATIARAEKAMRDLRDEANVHGLVYIQYRNRAMKRERRARMRCE